MPYVTVSGADLYYEEQGTGDPILCIHGTGSAAYAWASAAERLAAFGRVISYDRRGFTRSARPRPAETTFVQEHGSDAFAILQALAASPAVVIGRSYGGGVALELALRHPESVRALVLLEAVTVGLSATADAWLETLTATLEDIAAERGVEAVGEAMIREVVGDWESLPADFRELFTANSQAILAETRGGELAVDRAEYARITAPTLVVSSTDSPEPFREANDELVRAIPSAHAARVEGGHLIDPADAVVLEFLRDVLGPSLRT